MGTLQGQSTTNAAAVSQAAALAAIEGPTDELEKMRQEFDRRRRYMVEALRGDPGRQVRRAARALSTPSPICRPSTASARPAGKVIDGDPSLCEYLIEEARVAVVPGSSFYAPGFVRLSYATSQANIEKGVSRLGEALGKLV